MPSLYDIADLARRELTLCGLALDGAQADLPTKLLALPPTVTAPLRAWRLFRARRHRARAVVWLALHQNGHKATWDEAGSVSAVGLGFLADEDEGKDPEPSPESEGSTTQPSESSTD